MNTYKELFAYKDCRGLFVEGHDQLNLFENVHQEIDEDLWLNLFKRKTKCLITNKYMIDNYLDKEQRNKVLSQPCNSSNIGLLLFVVVDPNPGDFNDKLS